MTTQELKPCPFCGNSMPFSRQVSGRFYVKCGVCHAMAGEYEDKEAALNAWHTRPASEIETRDGLQQVVDDLGAEVDRLVRKNEQLKKELLADFVPGESAPHKIEGDIMDEQRQKEVEFFIRAESLFETRAIELTKIGSLTAAEQAKADARNALVWAERIRAGWVLRPGEEGE